MKCDSEVDSGVVFFKPKINKQELHAEFQPISVYS